MSGADARAPFGEPLGRGTTFFTLTTTNIMFNIESQARNMRHRGVSFEELRLFFISRDLYFKECRRIGYQIGDYIALSPIPWPDRWLPEDHRRGGRRRGA